MAVALLMLRRLSGGRGRQPGASNPPSRKSVRYAIKAGNPDANNAQEPIQPASCRLPQLLARVEGPHPLSPGSGGSFCKPRTCCPLLEIQLERKLAKAHGLEWEREGIGMLATNLHGNDLISTEVLHNVMILSDTLNRAVHGETITGQRAQQSLETGRVILMKLNEQDTDTD